MRADEDTDRWAGSGIGRGAEGTVEGGGLAIRVFARIGTGGVVLAGMLRKTWVWDVRRRVGSEWGEVTWHTIECDASLK